MKTRGELRLIEQALRNNWAITPKGAADAMALIDEVLKDPTASSRERLRAAKIVLLMETANMEIELGAQLLSQVRAIGAFLNARLKK